MEPAHWDGARFQLEIPSNRTNYNRGLRASCTSIITWRPRDPIPSEQGDALGVMLDDAPEALRRSGRRQMLFPLKLLVSCVSWVLEERTAIILSKTGGSPS